jgi:hypothetical protein
MSDILFFAGLTAAGLLALGGYVVSQWYGSGAVNVLRRAPLHPITGFPVGQAGRIVGVIEAYEGKSVVTPMTGRTCVAYAVRVEEHQGPGGSGGGWVPVIQDFDAVSFVVADDTGRALVQAAGTWPEPVMEEVGSSSMFTEAAPALEDLLRAHGQSSFGVAFRRRLRCEEGTLEVGMRVAVLGIGRHENEPLGDVTGGSYRESPGRLVIECLDDGSLPMSNAPSVLR